MPVWHEKTRDLQAAGQLQIVGIVQEQHPDRARLFRQWHGFEWPILVDRFNLLGLDVVPSFYGVDESGRWVTSLRKDEDFAAFMAKKPVADAHLVPRAQPRQLPTRLDPRLKPFAESNDGLVSEDWLFASLLFLNLNREMAWPKKAGESASKARDFRLSMLIGFLEEHVEALAAKGDNAEKLAAMRFRLGVAYRMRWERAFSEPEDFASAVRSWQQALDAIPSQYIWRRRIEQYGPRLGKPYPFYDWVSQAREELRARNETPVSLAVEPSGAEFAQPTREFVAVASTDAAAGDGVPLDDEGLVGINSTLVSNPKANGVVWRAHLSFTPQKGKWDEELREIEIHLSELEGVLATLPTRQSAAFSPQGRVTIEVEISLAESVLGTRIVVPCFALYHLCIDEDGTCVYRRQDFELVIDSARAAD